MRVIESKDPYTASAAFGYSSNNPELMDYMEHNNSHMLESLNENALESYNKSSELSKYFNSFEYKEELMDIKDSFGISSKANDIIVYDEETYTSISPYMKRIVMTNPYLYKEFDRGNISGFGNTDDYDDGLYASLYNGVSDHSKDMVMYVDSSEDEFDSDSLSRVQDVWEFYGKALMNEDDDLTDI